MTQSLTFQLPIPDEKLRPNSRFASRGGMILKSKAVKAARAVAKKEAERVLAGSPPPLWVKARYRAVLFTRTPARIDPDNLSASLKAYLDGICDAKVVKNDRALWPERPEYRLTERFPRVEITIEPE